MSAHGSSNTGSKTSTGTASAITTPANAGIGEDKPKVFDAQGAVGKQFTGEFRLSFETFTSSTIIVICNKIRWRDDEEDVISAPN